MADDKDDDLWTMFIDEDTSSDSASTPKPSDNKSNKRPKPLLKCVVCGDDAYGYNFDVISCESCKAFFRRNALKPPERLKCRGVGHCEITVATRKRCKRCRLDKCFRMGMRKEWILSDEDKLKKKSKMEENRRRKQSSDFPRPRRRRLYNYARAHGQSPEKTLSTQATTDESIPLMTDFDWSKIHQIQTAYNEAISYNQVVGVPPYPAVQPVHSTLDLIRIPTYLSSIRLITYLRKIPEFQLFDSDDRVTLVKHNLLAVVFMHIVLLYDPVADTYHEHNTQDPIFEGKDWIGILGDGFYHDITLTAKKLIQTVEYDRVIVKILLLIILFTKAFCGYDIKHEPSLNTPWVVHNTQYSYVELLYKYCLNQFGFDRTITLFSRLLNSVLSIQRLSAHFKDLVHSNVDASQLSPLMQSLLQVSSSTSI